MKFFSLLLDFIFPITCVGCNKEKTFCCEECLGKISLLKNQLCPTCGLPSNDGSFCSTKCQGALALDGLLAATLFEEHSPLARLIHHYKYTFAKSVAVLLASLIKNTIKNLPHNAVLIPIPLHPRRIRMRGFNQSELLAEELSKHYQIPLEKPLIRTRYTEPQAHLTKEKRQTNIVGAFSLSPHFKKLNGDAIYFLVDDVATTRSTLNEAAKVLKANSASKIYGLVIARTL